MEKTVFHNQVHTKSNLTNTRIIAVNPEVKVKRSAGYIESIRPALTNPTFCRHKFLCIDKLSFLLPQHIFFQTNKKLQQHTYIHKCSCRGKVGGSSEGSKRLMKDTLHIWNTIKIPALIVVITLTKAPFASGSLRTSAKTFIAT